VPSLRSPCHSFSVAPPGLADFPLTTHGLRRGLHSFAASRLVLCRVFHFSRRDGATTQTPAGLRCFSHSPRHFRAGLSHAAAARLDFGGFRSTTLQKFSSHAHTKAQHQLRSLAARLKRGCGKTATTGAEAHTDSTCLTRPWKGRSSTVVHAFVVLPQPLKAVPFPNTIHPL
jgi:hypothetical protein